MIPLPGPRFATRSGPLVESLASSRSVRKGGNARNLLFRPCNSPHSVNSGNRTRPSDRIRSRAIGAIDMLAPMKRCVLFIATVLLSGMSSPSAHADGKVFTHAAPAEIPSQSALIAYDGKVETLAIETRFIAEGKDFAWVVPLPAVPEIESGTPGMFASLRAMFLPEIISSTNTPAALVLVLLILLALGVWGTLLGAGPTWRIILYYVAGLSIFGSCLLLPSLGVARGPSGNDIVEVVDRKVIGEFELETVRSADAEALSEWLRARGFALPDAAQAAVHAYVKDGWVFVAVKLRREFELADLSAPTPLVFRFPSRSCIYPMRLTGAGASSPLDVELYVFADRAAMARSFRSVRHSTVAVVENMDHPPPSKSTDVIVSHRRVRELIGTATRATLLRATLRPDRMISDVIIDFDERREHGGVAIGRSLLYHVSVCGGLIVSCAVGMYYLRRRARPGRVYRPWLLVRNSALVGVAAGLLVLAVLPSIHEARGGWAEFMSAYRVRDSIFTIIDEIPDDATDAQIGTMMLKTAAQERPNLRLPKHEDSPGNFTVRRVDGGFEVSVYTWRGQELMERVVPRPRVNPPVSTTPASGSSP